MMRKRILLLAMLSIVLLSIPVFVSANDKTATAGLHQERQLSLKSLDDKLKRFVYTSDYNFEYPRCCAWNICNWAICWGKQI